MLFVGALNINKLPQQRAANILNNIIAVALFVISIINVVLNAYGLNYKADPLYNAAKTTGSL